MLCALAGNVPFHGIQACEASFAALSCEGVACFRWPGVVVEKVPTALLGGQVQESLFQW